MRCCYYDYDDKEAVLGSNNLQTIQESHIKVDNRCNLMTVSFIWDPNCPLKNG